MWVDGGEFRWLSHRIYNGRMTAGVPIPADQRDIALYAVNGPEAPSLAFYDADGQVEARPDFYPLGREKVLASLSDGVAMIRSGPVVLLPRLRMTRVAARLLIQRSVHRTRQADG